MSITVGEANKLISVVKSLQAAMDGVGKCRRDLLFELKQREDLDGVVYGALMDFDRLYLSVLSQGDDLETRALVAIRDAVGSEAGER